MHKHEKLLGITSESQTLGFRSRRLKLQQPALVGQTCSLPTLFLSQHDSREAPARFGREPELLGWHGLGSFVCSSPAVSSCSTCLPGDPYRDDGLGSVLLDSDSDEERELSRTLRSSTSCGRLTRMGSCSATPAMACTDPYNQTQMLALSGPLPDDFADDVELQHTTSPGDMTNLRPFGQTLGAKNTLSGSSTQRQLDRTSRHREDKAQIAAFEAAVRAAEGLDETVRNDLLEFLCELGARGA